MAIAFDASAKASPGSGASSLTFSHTCSGSDRALLVGSFARGANQFSDIASGVTYNAVSLTEIASAVRDGQILTCSAWYLVTPATGANDVVVSYDETDSTWVHAVSQSFTGVDSADPLSGSATNNEASVAQTDLTVTTLDDGAVVNSIVAGTADAAYTALDGQTATLNEDANPGAGTDVCAAGYEIVGAAGAYDQNWSFQSGNHYAGILTTFKPAAGGGAATGRGPLVAGKLVGGILVRLH